jgi:hypothetical protein
MQLIAAPKEHFGQAARGEMKDLPDVARWLLFEADVTDRQIPRIAKIFLPSLRQRAHSAATGMDHRWQQSFISSNEPKKPQHVSGFRLLD